MFGLGISKLIVLAGIVMAIWYGFKVVGKLDRARRRQQGEERRRPRPGAKPAAVEDTVQCTICGAYVVARNASPCERPDCPY